MNNVILQTSRLCFTIWNEENLADALALWGNQKVSRYITKGGVFSQDEIKARLDLEIRTYKEKGYQYYPVWEKKTGAFVGCCGFRPFEAPGAEISLEFGIHFLPVFWGSGYGAEAGLAMLSYGFDHLHAAKIFAGHHPENKASEKLMLKLGFQPLSPKFYPPTGQYHPSYEITGPGL